MQYSYTGAARVGSSGFDAIKSIQHSRTNILTSDDFKTRTLVDMIIRFLNRRVQP